jgi:FMN phosphatase YigB (HAD superfamily)
MKKKTLIFDFDDTLFNSAKLKEILIGESIKLGLNKSAARRQYLKLRTSSFSPEKYGTKAFSKDNQKIFIARFKTQITPNLVYPGARQLLAKLGKEYRLVLFSYGDPAFQAYKVQKSGLKKYFSDALFTTQITKGEGLLKLKAKYGAEALMIDNSQAVVTLAKHIGIKAIKVKEGFKDSEYFKKLIVRIRK